MTSDGRGFDLAAWTESVAAGETGAALVGAAASVVATGTALLSMSFRSPDGETDEPEVYRAGRADELDALRGRALEIALAEAEAGAPWDADGEDPSRKAKRREAELERAVEVAELALAAVRIALAGERGAAERRAEWEAGVRWLGVAAEVARDGVVGRAEEGDVRRRVAGSLAREVGEMLGERSRDGGGA